jgi:hypothetical protein
MGMKQKRCPWCRKKRRFVEGGGDHERNERSEAWEKINGVWVCSYCVAKEPRDLDNS